MSCDIIKLHLIGLCQLSVIFTLKFLYKISLGDTLVANFVIPICSRIQRILQDLNKLQIFILKIFS